jgi:hypothetical protein
VGFQLIQLQIEGLRIQYQSVKPALDYIQTSHDDVPGLREGIRSIEILCEQTKKTFAALDKLIEDFRPNGTRKPKKTMWVCRKAELLRLKRQAKHNTTSLIVSLSSFSHLQTWIKIGMLHSRLEVPRHILTRENYQLLSTAGCDGNLAIDALRPTASTESFYTVNCDDVDETSSRESSGDPSPSTETNTTCKRYCRCKCHPKFQACTPGWIKLVLGTFILNGGGTSHFRRLPCDQEDCCRNKTIYVQMTYMAPSWMFLKALALCAQAEIVSGSIRSYNISIPRTIEYTAKVWSLIELGCLSELKALFDDGLVTPYDVAMDGTSLLKVRLIYSQRLCYVLMILQYAVIHQQDEVYSFLLALGASPLYCDQSGA